MRILITGGCGFIGSHLADHCLANGWKVTVLDDLSTGSLNNVEHLLDNRDFRVVQGSTSNESVVDELVASCDFIFHLAAVVGVKLIVDQPLQSIQKNLTGTETVLRAAHRHWKPFLLTSTSEVYGKSPNLPFREDADLSIGPPTISRWSYACSKALDEFLALAYWREYGLPVIVVRLFNTVGPRQSGAYGMVIPNFIGQALSNQPITIFGLGNQRRCFGYVEDVVKALGALSKTPDAYGQVVNIGGTAETTISDLAYLVKKVSGSSSEVEYISYEEAYGAGFEDMERRVPAVDKLKRLVGFKPQSSLERIIAETVEWMKRQEKVSTMTRAQLAAASAGV